MSHLRAPAPFQYIKHPHKVGVGIVVGMLNAVAHTSLCRQVNNPVKVLGLEQGRHCITLRNVQA